MGIAKEADDKTLTAVLGSLAKGREYVFIVVEDKKDDGTVLNTGVWSNIPHPEDAFQLCVRVGELVLEKMEEEKGAP